MGLLKKKNKKILDKNNSEDNTSKNIEDTDSIEENFFGDDTDQEEITVEANNNTERMSEEQEETTVETNTPKKTTKKPQIDLKNLTKQQKIVLSTVVISSVLLFAFSGGSDEKKHNSIKENIEQYDIKVNQDMDILEASKNKDFLTRLKLLEDKLAKKSTNNGDSSKIDIEKIKAMKFKGYQELSLILFTNQYKISNQEYIYRKGNQILHHLFQGNEIVLDNIAAIAINNGAFLRMENLDTDYIINSNDMQDVDLKNIKSIDIWRIDPNTGLKKILVNDVKKDILSYLNQDDTPEDILIKKYLHKILLIGKNGEIKEEIDFFSKKNNEIATPKNIIKSYSLKEFTTENFQKYYIENNSIYLDGEKQFEKKGLYSLKYMKYNDPETGVTEKVFLFRNGKIIKSFELSDLRNFSLVSYKNKEGEEYVNKDGMVYQVNKDTGLLDEIGSGTIFGKISDGKLNSVSLSIIESSEEKLPIDNLVGKILIDENDIEYKITEDGVNYQDTILPISSFKITSSGFLFYEDEKIAKIKEIKLINKTGASILTASKKINLYSKDKYEIFDLDNNLLFNENDYENVDFDLNFEKETITATALVKSKVDFESKTINNIPFDTYELRNDKYFLYDEDGILKKEIPLTFTKVLFEEKVKSFELIDGEIFDYYFQIDTLSGKIDSNEVGKFIEKYQKDKIPFSQFKKKNSFKTLNKTIDSKIQNTSLEGQDIVLLNDLLEGRTFPFITFTDMLGNRIKILDEKTLLINDKDTIEGLKIYLNQSKSKFLVNILPKMLNRKIEKKYKIKVINKTFSWFYKTLTLDDYNYIERKTGTKFFKDNLGTLYLKFKKDKNFIEVLSSQIDLLNDSLIVTDINDNSYTLVLSDLIKMSDKESEIYLKLLDRFLHPKVSDEAKKKKEEEARKKAERLKKSEMFKKQMEEFQNQKSELQTISLNEKKVNEIKQQNTEPDFTFEIGSKLKFIIKESMEVVEGEQGFALGYISNLTLKDMSDNILHIKNAKVVLGLEGDFSKEKIIVSPLKIIYKDSDTGEKRVIDIPQSASQFIYREDGYNSIGVPSYMINAKLKNINTTVILSTVSGVLENLTQPQDTLSQLTNTTNTTTIDGVDNQSQTIGQAAGAGINQGIQDLLNTIKDAADKEKNILISEPNVKGYSLFIEEVEVKFSEEK